MIRLNKIALSALAILTLASCSATENSGQVKGALIEYGFPEARMTQLSGEAYIKTMGADFKADGLQEYLAATKPVLDGLPEEFYCWFFDNSDNAGKFVDEHVADMYYSLKDRVSDPAMGSRNNVAWCGTKWVSVKLGWSLQ